MKKILSFAIVFLILIASVLAANGDPTKFGYLSNPSNSSTTVTTCSIGGYAGNLSCVGNLSGDHIIGDGSLVTNLNVVNSSVNYSQYTNISHLNVNTSTLKTTNGLLDIVSSWWTNLFYTKTEIDNQQEIQDNISILLNRTKLQNGSSANLPQLQVDKISYNITAVNTFGQGQCGWDTGANAISCGYPYGTTLQLGEEMYKEVTNLDSITLTEGTAVSIISASGNREGVARTNISSTISSTAFIGLITSTNCTINQKCLVTLSGDVHDLDTNNFTEGMPVYVSTTPGVLTDVFPTAPDYIVMAGVVTVKNQNNGIIAVTPAVVQKLSGLSDVDGTPINTTGQILVWNNTRQVWDAIDNINNYYTKTSINSQLSTINITSNTILNYSIIANSTANIANTTANNALSYSITANSTANIANNTANVANSTANSALSYSITANSTANIANNTANVANNTSNSALSLANHLDTDLNSTISNLSTEISSRIGNDSLKRNLSDEISWSNLTNYPVACPANNFMTQVGDTITCTSVQEVPLNLLVDNNLTVLGNANITGNITANTGFMNINWSFLTNIPSYVRDWYTMINIANSTANIANSTANSALSYSIIANSTANIANNTANALVASNSSMNTRVTNLESSNTTQATAIANINTTANTMQLYGADQYDPQGFPDYDNTNADTHSRLSFNATTRNFTVGPVGASFNYEIAGITYTISTNKTVTIANTTGTHFTYFDNGGNLQTTMVFNRDLLCLQSIVGYVYYDATRQIAYTVNDERHTRFYPCVDHYNEHMKDGTSYLSGLAPQNVTVAGSNAANTSAQFSISAGSIVDEDYTHNIISLGFPTKYLVYYQLGSTNNWSYKRDYFPFIYSGDSSGYTGANSRIAYNLNTAGTWSLTQTSANNNIVLIHVLATNTIANDSDIIIVEGQAQYTTAALATTGASTEISNIKTAGLFSSEWTPLYTFLVQTNGGWTNVPRAIIVAPSTGGQFIDWRQSQISGASGSSVGGTVTLIDTGTGLTGGPITSTGIISVDNTYAQTFNETGRVDSLNTTKANLIGGNNWQGTQNFTDAIFNGTVYFRDINVTTENVTNINATGYVAGLTLWENAVSLVNKYVGFVTFYALETRLNSTQGALGATNTTANGKASPGTCSGSTVVQNTTTGGVQCIAIGGSGTVTSITANGSGLIGGTITSTGSIAINSSYFDATYSSLSYVITANNTANIANNTANALVASNSSMNTRMNNMESSNTTQATDIANLVASNSSMDTRVTAISNNLGVTNTTANNAYAYAAHLDTDLNATMSNLGVTNTTANNALSYVVIANSTANIANNTANVANTTANTVSNNLGATNTTVNNLITNDSNLNGRINSLNTTKANLAGGNSFTGLQNFTDASFTGTVYLKDINVSTENVTNINATGYVAGLTLWENAISLVNKYVGFTVFYALETRLNSTQGALGATNTTANNALSYVIIANSTANIANTTANTVSSNLGATNTTLNTLSTNVGIMNTTLNSAVSNLGATNTTANNAYTYAAHLDTDLNSTMSNLGVTNTTANNALPKAGGQMTGNILTNNVSFRLGNVSSTGNFTGVCINSTGFLYIGTNFNITSIGC